MVHPEDADTRPRAVLGSALLLALGAGAICLAAGGLLLLGDSGLGTSLLVVGVLMPLLAVQEVGRFISFAQATPSRAIVLDVMEFPLRHPARVALDVDVERELELHLNRVGGPAARLGRKLIRSPRLRRAARAVVNSSPAKSAARVASRMSSRS